MGSRASRLSVLGIAIAVLLMAGSADAQEAEDTSGAEARALVLTREALQRYQDGELDQAVQLLTEARALHPGEPLLLYNLARAYEGLGRLVEARDAYAGYLVEAPDAPERGAVEVRIASIDRSLAERARLEEEERTARLEAERARREAARGPSVAPWIVLSAGAAVLAVGGVLSGVAVSERDAALATMVHGERASHFATAEDHALAANVLFAAGGTVALVAVIWGIVDLATASAPSEAVALRLDGGTLALSF
jgi:tetratricopeptide (TPR) repeat protein